MKIIFTLSLLMILSSCAPKIEKDSLVGQWQLKKETLTINLLLKNDNSFECSVNLEPRQIKDEKTKFWVFGMSTDFKGVGKKGQWSLNGSELRLVSSFQSEVPTIISIESVSPQSMALNVYKKDCEFIKK